MPRTTHVKSHVRSQRLNDPAAKRDAYIKYAREASIDNIDNAKKYLSLSISKPKFEEFMTKAFVNEPGNYTSEDYAIEWAERFNKGREWAVSDFQRRHVLQKVFPEKYGNTPIGDE